MHIYWNLLDRTQFVHFSLLSIIIIIFFASLSPSLYPPIIIWILFKCKPKRIKNLKKKTANEKTKGSTILISSHVITMILLNDQMIVTFLHFTYISNIFSVWFNTCYVCDISLTFVIRNFILCLCVRVLWLVEIDSRSTTFPINLLT